MAGNKINARTKGKDEKGKVNKQCIDQTNDDTEDPDFALLRKPIHTSITGFGQARKIFDMATEELKGLLSNECDILYECKVCRNIFRSLANFISHKRVYCKDKFKTTIHSHFIRTTSTISELMKIKQVEEEYQESLKDKHVENIELAEVDKRIPLTKDLTAIIEKIAEKEEMHENSTEEPQINLQKIPNSSVAVFQNVKSSQKKLDNMRIQVNELENLLSRNVAVLQKDGNFKIQSSNPSETGSVIQISDDEEIGDIDVLKCKTCDLQFSTQKTLRFHMKYKHVESRLVYPCTDCLEIFSTSWSVYRHLFKVHRKSAAQIRRLRESIQAKAFKMNNPPAFYEKRKNNMKSTAQKITEEERIDQENQAWMENMEGLGSVPRCGGCGRAFERRAALAAHAHTCQPRSRALAPPHPLPHPHPAPAPAPASTRRPDAKRIEIQIRKDYNKGPTAPTPPPPPPPPANRPQPPTDDDNKRVDDEASSKSSKDRDVKRPEETRDEDIAMDDGEDDARSTDAVDIPERKAESKSVPESFELVIRLPHDRRAEKNNIVALKQKIKLDIEIDTLTCIKCESRHANVRELYEHAAGHYGWMRYACKLCNFKHYEFEKLPEHVKVVHKLKGDKDFYFSTVKAIDGPEALELLDSREELNNTNEVSPDSRRPSRCSSDSSRLSDDSSSSSTRIEVGARKRKMYHSKVQSKRRKESLVKVGEEQKEEDSQDKDIGQGDNESFTNVKIYEENSSDMDDVDERIAKRQMVENSVSIASKRPVRRRTKPKNEDFEYDLSNLLKMEAQGYRDSQSVTSSKTNPNKKKTQQDNLINYDNINKDCCGALVTLSKKAVEISAAHMKITNFALQSTQKEQRSSNIFVRPMLPKSFSRGEKISPKKDSIEDKKDIASPNKETKNKAVPVEDSSDDQKNAKKNDTNDISVSTKEQKDSNKSIETTKNSLNPLKFCRQSLDLIKNPLINKNITDFTKAGMKTKILVIKPINRNKDGTSTTNSPLKFQTIKIKDPSRNSFLNDNKSSEQVVVVKVPKVSDCSKPRPESGPLNVEQSLINTPIESNSTTLTDSTECTSRSNDDIDGLLIAKDAETSEKKITNIIGKSEPVVSKDDLDDSIDTSKKLPTNQPEIAVSDEK